MKNNLEEIHFDKVINKDGLPYIVFRKHLNPSYKKALFDIGKGFFFLAITISGAQAIIHFQTIWSFLAIVLFAILVGYILAYLHLFIHAAAHYNLHRNKRINDQISDYLLGALFGIEQKKYRRIHWMHHQELGKTTDTEHTYFNELNTGFLLKCLTGFYAISIIFKREKYNRQSHKIPTSGSFIIYTAALHITLITGMLLLGGWKLLVVWLAGLTLFFPAFAALRQLLEHRDVDAKSSISYFNTDHGKLSRLFGSGIIDSSFGAAGFNKHLLHHWDPTLSYTSLAKVEDYLLDCPATHTILKESKTSYVKTFLALFKI